MRRCWMVCKVCSEYPWCRCRRCRQFRWMHRASRQMNQPLCSMSLPSITLALPLLRRAQLPHRPSSPALHLLQMHPRRQLQSCKPRSCVLSRLFNRRLLHLPPALATRFLLTRPLHKLLPVRTLEHYRGGGSSLSLATMKKWSLSFSQPRLQPAVAVNVSQGDVT